MSGFVRTLQKSSLKRAGYERQKERLVVRHGRPQVIRLKKGEGPILDADGESTGSRIWPLSMARSGRDEKQRLSAYRPRKGRKPGANDCWLPSVEADRADLAEMHGEKMRLKKAHRARRAA